MLVVVRPRRHCAPRRQAWPVQFVEADAKRRGSRRRWQRAPLVPTKSRGTMLGRPCPSRLIAVPSLIELGQHPGDVLVHVIVQRRRQHARARFPQLPTPTWGAPLRGPTVAMQNTDSGGRHLLVEPNNRRFRARVRRGQGRCSVCSRAGELCMNSSRGVAVIAWLVGCWAGARGSGVGFSGLSC